MPDIFDATKRLLVGRPVRSAAEGKTLLPKAIALPVFASDALSSVAYAPDEIMLTLALAGGISLATASIPVGIAVVLVMAVVVMSYRQTVHAYPSGGGDYEVATANLGPKAGLTVASALLVDYVLTVAVSISQGAAYLSTAIPELQGYEVYAALILVVILALMNLRGVRESGTAFAIPTYLYMGSIGLMAVVGMVKYFTGTLGEAATAKYTVLPDADYSHGLLGIAGFFLLLRAFSSGCAALTGIEAISNGVPSFRKPKSKNAATTLALLGGISATMMISILFLAHKTGVQMVDNPAKDFTLEGRPVGPNVTADPVIGQLADTIFSNARPLFYLVTIVTGLILVLAANTAFNGFPLLASTLSRDSFLPRQLYTRGDRLAYSNGIIVLAIAASALIYFFDAKVTSLIHLYVVGVFVSFVLGQLGMIRHWTKLLRVETERKKRSHMQRSRVINVIGFCTTLIVLSVVLITKFTHGAWLAIVFMVIIFIAMHGVYRHYRNTEQELQVEDTAASLALPSRVHAIILVSHLHKPAMRAISYARVTNPSSMEIVSVMMNSKASKHLRQQWEESGVQVPLTFLSSPYRDVTGPVLRHVRSIRRISPRDLVVVYIPEYQVKHWWERILHNQTALRLRTRLMFVPGVVLALVPWRLDGTVIPDNSKLVAPELAKPNQAKPTTPGQ